MKYLLIAINLCLVSSVCADERGKVWDAASRAEYKVQIEITKCNAGDCRGLKKALKVADKAQDAVEKAEKAHRSSK